MSGLMAVIPFPIKFHLLVIVDYLWFYELSAFTEWLHYEMHKNCLNTAANLSVNGNGHSANTLTH